MSKALSLELLVCGWLTAPAGLWRQGDSLRDRLRIPVPVYLIRHARGTMLVDCGLHPDAIADPPDYYGDAVARIGFEQERSVADLVDLERVDVLAVTHLHYDHVGALELIPGQVPILIQRAEWDAGRDAAAVARNVYMPRDYSLKRDFRLLDGAHDVFGDGQVTLFPSPGHTPGHQSVRVGRQILAADVAYFNATFDDLRFPPYGDDRARQRDSVRLLRRMRSAGYRLLPGHDPKLIVPGPVCVDGGYGPARLSR